MSRSKTSNALENNGFAVFLIHFKLRRECKEDYTKMGGSNLGNYRIVQLMWSLGGSERGHFKGVPT